MDPFSVAADRYHLWMAGQVIAKTLDSPRAMYVLMLAPLSIVNHGFETVSIIARLTQK